MKFLIWFGLTVLLALGGAIAVTSVVPNYSPHFNGSIIITVFVVAPLLALIICALLVDHNAIAEEKELNGEENDHKR